MKQSQLDDADSQNSEATTMEDVQNGYNPTVDEVELVPDHGDTKGVYGIARNQYSSVSDAVLMDDDSDLIAYANTRPGTQPADGSPRRWSVQAVGELQIVDWDGDDVPDEVPKNIIEEVLFNSMFGDLDFEGVSGGDGEIAFTIYAPDWGRVDIFADLV